MSGRASIKVVLKAEVEQPTQNRHISITRVNTDLKLSTLKGHVGESTSIVVPMLPPSSSAPPLPLPFSFLSPYAIFPQYYTWCRSIFILRSHARFVAWLHLVCSTSLLSRHTTACTSKSGDKDGGGAMEEKEEEEEDEGVREGRKEGGRGGRTREGRKNEGGEEQEGGEEEGGTINFVMIHDTHKLPIAATLTRVVCYVVQTVLLLESGSF